MPMWRRSVHDKYGYFNEKYATAADADLWLKAAKEGSKMKKIDDIVGIYYHNPKGRSSDPDTLQKMVDEVTKMRQIYEPTYTLPIKPSNQ